MNEHTRQAPLTGADVELTCQDCLEPFTFTAGEQQYYEARGFTSPRRCRDCREAKRLFWNR